MARGSYWLAPRIEHGILVYLPRYAQYLGGPRGSTFDRPAIALIYRNRYGYIDYFWGYLDNPQRHGRGHPYHALVEAERIARQFLHLLPLQVSRG